MMRSILLSILYITAGILETVNPSSSRGVPVLMYHRISDEYDDPVCVRPTYFERQMGWLKKWGYRSLSLDEFTDYILSGEPLPARSVLITFDDGYFNNEEIAKPIMDAHEYQGTIFVATAYIGTNSSFASTKKNASHPLLNSEQLIRLEQTGWDIANHLHSHQKMIYLQEQEMRAEYRLSYRALVDIGISSTNAKRVALPKDRYNQQVKDVLAEEGAELVFAGKGIALPKSDPFSVPRTEIPDTGSRLIFRAHLSFHLYDSLQAYYKLKGFVLNLLWKKN